jgi:hypothetical protein
MAGAQLRRLRRVGRAYVEVRPRTIVAHQETLSVLETPVELYNRCAAPVAAGRYAVTCL